MVYFFFIPQQFESYYLKMKEKKKNILKRIEQ